MPRNITYAKLFKLDMIPDIRLSTNMVGTESWDSLFINWNFKCISAVLGSMTKST